MPPRSQFDPDDLIQRYQAGEPLRSLCKHSRSDRATISEVLREHGIEPRNRADAIRLARGRDVDAPALAAAFRAGGTVRSLGKAFGVDRYVVRRVLREQGIEPRTGTQTRRILYPVTINEAEAVRRYLAGESAKTLAGSYGVGEGTIARVLRENGVELRSIAQANALFAERLPMEQRQARATRHVVVWEGRSYPRVPITDPSRARKKAITQQRTLAQQRQEERDIIAQLPAGWVDGQQVAVHFYNIDFTHGPVAVEIHSASLHPFRTEKTASRAIDLADSGWHVVFFWPNSGTYRVRPRGIQELVAHVERLDRNPSPTRQYLVVRGGGELVTAGRFDLEQRSLVPTPVDPQEAAHR